MSVQHLDQLSSHSLPAPRGAAEWLQEGDGHTLEPRAPCSMSVKSRGSHDLFPFWTLLLLPQRPKGQEGNRMRFHKADDKWHFCTWRTMWVIKRQKTGDYYCISSRAGQRMLQICTSGTTWRAVFVPIGHGCITWTVLRSRARPHNFHNPLSKATTALVTRTHCRHRTGVWRCAQYEVWSLTARLWPGSAPSLPMCVMWTVSLILYASISSSVRRGQKSPGLVARTEMSWHQQSRQTDYHSPEDTGAPQCEIAFF